MINKCLILCAALTLAIQPAAAQTKVPENELNSPIYKLPVHVFGQIPDPNNAGLSISYAPNLVEGREFYAPQSVALDTGATPPILYVADTANNRVLAWRDAQAATGAAQADLVIGQPDFISTRADYPTLRTGLESPSALAVDANGNLYVLDAGNNRILRFPRPFDDTANPKTPDAVIGQPDFNSSGANPGGITANGLRIRDSNSTALPCALLMDFAGNLWVTDTGNHRVLRYDSSALAQASSTPVAASVVLGQIDMVRGTYADKFDTINKFYRPFALALDSTNNLYVADGYHRVLAFQSPFSTGQSAARFIGSIQGGSAPNFVPLNPPTKSSFALPQGLAVSGNSLIVADTGNHRLLKYPLLSQWPSGTMLPEATAVIGQPGFTQNNAGTSSTALSSPMHVFATPAEIYVADALNNRVAVFPADGTVASRVIGQTSPEYGGVNLADANTVFTAAVVARQTGNSIMGGGVAIDTRSTPPRMYVADTFNNRVLAFCDARRAGEVTLILGQPNAGQTRANYNPDGSAGRGNSNLSWPMGVAVDTSGNLFVADYGNSRVLRFPDPCADPSAEHHADLVIGQSDFTSRETTASASHMSGPYGLALMPEGHLLVSDANHNRVLLFRKPDGGDFTNGQDASTVFGQFNFSTTAAGAEPYQMSDPRFIATDSSGRLYVADYTNRRILVFTEVNSAPSGSRAALAVTRAFGNDLLIYPHGIAVDQDTGELWVTVLSDSRSPLYRYPEYSVMNNPLNPNPAANLRLPMATPGMGVALNGKGAMIIVEQGNRISRYVPPVEVTDNGNYVAYRPIAPGMIATLWPGSPPYYQGRQFAEVETDAYDRHDPQLVPLPTEMAGTQLLVDGRPAPLYFVSAGQINFYVPKDTRTSGAAELQLVRTETGEIVAAGQAPMVHAQPAFLMHWDAPFERGQVAALSAGYEGSQPPGKCNGPELPAAQQDALRPWCPGGVGPVRRGEFVSLFLTGSGVYQGMPDDGVPAPGNGIWLDNNHTLCVVVGLTDECAEINFSGAAPGLIGVWQINAKVPRTLKDGMHPVGVGYRDRTAALPGTDSNHPDWPKITVKGGL